MNAFRPTIGTTQGSGAQFQHFVDQEAVATHYAQIQAGSANQIPLPTIAPRPSPQDDNMGPMATGIIGQRDLYNAYGYTYDGQQHARHDLPPHVHQSLPQQGYWDGNIDVQNTEQLARYYAASDALKTFRGPNNSDGDVGTDANYLTQSGSDPILNSNWSRVSDSSNLPTPAYAQNVGYGTTVSSSIDPGMRSTKTSPQLMYLKQEHQDHPGHVSDSIQYVIEGKRESGFQAPLDSGQISHKQLSANQDDRAVKGLDGGVGK